MEDIKLINSIKFIAESFDTIYLSKFLVISRSKAYSLITSNHIPHYKLNRKIIIFKQHFIEWLKKDTITPFNELKIIKKMPDLFPPSLLLSTLNISKSKIYEIIKEYDLNCLILGKKIIISKENFIKTFLKFSYC